MLPRFSACSNIMFEENISFVKHLYSYQVDNFHQIILRMVQCSYSVLISKIKINPDSLADVRNTKFFDSIHLGRVSLPSLICSTSNYDTFSVEKNGTIITLVKTNILKHTPNRDLLWVQ